MQIKTWHCIVALCVCLFAVYATTAPRSVALEDDALFIGNLHFFGVAHPPGYPLYTLAGGLLYHAIFFLDPAYKAHLISGIAATATCCALFIILRQLAIPLITATLTAFAYGVSKTFWSQAIIAEVYTFNTFLFFATTACILHAIQTNKWQWSIPILIACGLSVHHPLFILAGIGWIVFLPSLYRMDKKRFLWSPLIIAVIVIIFYGWMVWRSHANPVYNFSGSIASIGDFWQHISRGVYRDMAVGGASWHSAPAYLAQLTQAVMSELHIAAFVFTALGSGVLFYNRRIAAALWITFLCSSVLLVFLVPFPHTQHHLNVFRVYPLVAYGVISIWLGVGVCFVAQRLRRPILAPIFAAVIAIAVFANHWDFNNRQNDHWAQEFAQMSLDAVPPNHTLFVRSDWDLPIGYVHFVEQTRPDLHIIPTSGLIYNTRLYPYVYTIDTKDPDAYVHARTVISRTLAGKTPPQTVFYTTYNHGALIQPYAYHSLGFVNQVYLQQPPAQPPDFHTHSIDWLSKFNATEIRDPWTIIWRYRLNRFMTRQLTRDNATMPENLQTYLAAAHQQFPSLRIRHLIRQLHRQTLTPDEQQQAVIWLEDQPPPDPPIWSIYEASDYYYLYALLVEQLHDRTHPLYLQQLRAGLSAAPSHENKNLLPFLQYYAHYQPCDYTRIAEMIPQDRAALQLWAEHLPPNLTTHCPPPDTAK